MKINRTIGAAVTALLVAGGLAFAAAPASATTDGELCVPVDAWTETIPHPAVGEPTITIPNPDHVPAVPEQSHVVTHPAETKVVHHPAETKLVEHEAETHTEWKYAKHGGYGFLWLTNDTFKYVDGNGNGLESKPKYGEFYERTQHTRVVVDKAAWVETVTVKDAYDETVVIKEAWDEVVIDVPGKDAIGDPAITVPNPDYVAAHDEVVEHPAVECPPAPANPTATLTAVCGEATAILTNPIVGDANQVTASFVVNVDGTFYGAYAVEAGGREELEIAFGEDTGTHTVEIYQAGTSEWKLIAEGDVTSDCVTPPVAPEEPEEPTTPVVPVVPAQPAPAAVPAAAPVKAKTVAAEDTLAQTGGEPLWLGAVGASLLLAVGAGLYRRRRTI